MLHFALVLRNIKYYRGSSISVQSIGEFRGLLYHYDSIRRIKRLMSSQLRIDRLSYFGLFIPTFWANGRNVRRLRRQMDETVFMNTNQYFDIFINAALDR